MRWLRVQAPEVRGIVALSTQRAQHPLNKEYTFNHIQDPLYKLKYTPSFRGIGLFEKDGRGVTRFAVRASGRG